MDAILEMMKRRGIPETRENYLPWPTSGIRLKSWRPRRNGSCQCNSS